jgi:hypothetical protein
MRGLVIIRRCELGYENIILIVGSCMYFLSVASTPSYVFDCLASASPCVAVDVCARLRLCGSCMLFASVGEVFTRISIALCYPLCDCSGLSPVVLGEYCNERTNENAVRAEKVRALAGHVCNVFDSILTFDWSPSVEGLEADNCRISGFDINR